MADNPFSQFRQPLPRENPFARFRHQAEAVVTPQPQEGLGRTVLDQGLQGATFGFADEITDRIGAGIAAHATDESYDSLLNEARGESRARMQRQMEQRPSASIAANLAGGLLTGGAGASTKAGTAVANSLRAGGTVARIGKGAAAGAATGAAYGAGSAREGERLSGAGEGAVVGGLLGGAVPAAGAALSRTLKPIGDVNKRRQAFSAMLEGEGVPLTAAQKTGSKTLQFIEDAFASLPATANKQAAIRDQQFKKFNEAVLKRVGIKASEVTEDVVQAAEKKIGAKLNQLAAKTKITVDDTLRNELAEIQSGIKRLGRDDQAIVRNYLDDIIPPQPPAAVREPVFDPVMGMVTPKSPPPKPPPVISGEVYQASRSEIGQRANAMQDRFAARLLKRLQTSLDEAAERAAPDEATRAGWKEARKQWQSLMNVKDAMRSTSMPALEGNIVPEALAIAARTGNRGYTTGQGELNQLSKAGKLILGKPLPSSGTSERALYQNLLQGKITSPAGAVVGGFAGGPVGAVAGAAAPYVLPKLAQALYNSRAGQTYLTKGLATLPNSPKARIALTNALIQQSTLR